MAQSVSVPRNAINVAFADGVDDSDDFDFCIEQMQDALRDHYPSLRQCSVFVGREDRAVLENEVAYITVSEYCGLVAIAAVPKDGAPVLGATFCHRARLDIAAQCFGVPLKYRGTFSNGDAVFEPEDGQQRGRMGLGFTSKEGWL